MSGCLTPGGASGGLSGGTKYRASRPGRTSERGRGGVWGGNSRVGEGSSSESIEGEGRGETNKDLCVQKLPTPQLSVFITPLL